MLEAYAAGRPAGAVVMGSNLYSCATAEATVKDRKKAGKTKRLIMVFGSKLPGRDGAGDRIRTGDIDLGKVALYQLSYSRSTQNSILTGNIPDVKRYG